MSGFSNNTTAGTTTTTATSSASYLIPPHKVSGWIRCLLVCKFDLDVRQVCDKEIPENLRETVSFALRNNTPALIDTGDPENPKIVGANPTGQALLRFLGADLAKHDDVKVKVNIPFNSTYKFSATQVEGSQNLTMVKGAAEIVLAGCTHYLDVDGNKIELDSEKLKEEMQGLSKRAMRLIGLAVSNQDLEEENVLPPDLTLVGIFGLRDEMRKESKTAVETARRAGIQVVMITGDAKDTAQAIAREVGILEKEQTLVLTSKELGEISDDELIKILPDMRVVARALPADKNRLVKLAKCVLNFKHSKLIFTLMLVMFAHWIS